MTTIKNKTEKQGILTAISLCKDTINDFKTTTVDYWEAKQIFFPNNKDIHVGMVIKTPDKTLEIIDINLSIFDEINTNEYGFDKSWVGEILPNNFLVRVVVKEI